MSVVAILACGVTTSVAKPIHIPQFSFGSPGTGAGQLSLQAFKAGEKAGTSEKAGSGIAVNQATQDIYVADSGNHRVDQFDQEGNFIRAWGFGVADGTSSALQTCTVACHAGLTGSEPGQLADPAFVAVDNSPGGHGDVYVADYADNVITKFDAEGHLISSWAKGGQLTETATLATGSGDVVAGSATGQGDLSEGSTLVTDVVTSTGAFAVGLGITGGGIEGGPTYITAVGTDTLTLSRPASRTVVGTELTTNTKFVTNLSVNSGAFEANQSISGAGIPAATQIREAGPGFLVLEKETTPGTGITLSAKFIFGHPVGLVTDIVGNLWLEAGNGNGSAQMYEFAPSGVLVTDWLGGVEGSSAIAIDSHDHLFADVGYGTVEFDSSGASIGVVEDASGHGQSPTGFAIDPATDDLYVDVGKASHPGTEINHFLASCEPAAGLCAPAEIFGSGSLAEGQGLAVGSEHRVYAADADSSTVVAFKQVNVPTATTGQVANLGQSTATLQGQVNPEGSQVIGCLFEYVDDSAYEPAATDPYAAGQTAPCAETVGSGASVVAVHADISGLAPLSYHFRLVATNANGTDRGGDQAFGASVDSSEVQSATAAEAVLIAQINPHGLDTTCQLQYVTEEEFDASQFSSAQTVACEPTDLGSTDATDLTCTPLQEANGCIPDALVAATVADLDPQTNYRFRFLATSKGHTTNGPDRAFFTYSNQFIPGSCSNETLRKENGSLGLPNCRAYEQVSARESAAVYIPVTQFANPQAGLTNSGQPMQTSPDGGSVVYAGEPPSSGEGEGTGNSAPGETDNHIAIRGQSGWESSDIEPLGSNPTTRYQAFSSDLSSGILISSAGEPGEPASAGRDTGCSRLFSRSLPDGIFRPLLSGTPCDFPGQPPFLVGASTARSHLVFESATALTPGSKRASGEIGHENIYDSVDEQIYQINILPGAKPKSAPDATAGALANEPALTDVSGNYPPVNISNVVSGDGSRVFWTNLATGIVYVRENDTAEPSPESGGHCTQPELACTVQISLGSASYETASPDGRYAYYTETGRLWRFDLSTYNQALSEDKSVEESNALARTPVTPESAEVQAVIGVNAAGNDGDYLYFVAKAALAANPIDNGNGPETAQAGQPNVYLSHEGTLTFIATLLPGDNNFEGNPLGNPHPSKGDWRPVLGYRSSQLSADGRHLVFMSKQPLTASSNSDSAGNSTVEVYLYDAGDGRITCISCSPAGVLPSPEPNEGQTSGGRETFLPGTLSRLAAAPRVISRNGQFVFFNSSQPLVPEDTNGVQDVYEWERSATKGCVHGSTLNGGGCLYLLSGAAAGSWSFLVDSDEEGGNAFFVTFSPLAASDHDEKPDLYDVRENGGFPASAETHVCKSEGCRGPVPSPPNPPSPGTARFQVNESPPPCKRNFVLRHGKCVKKKRHKARRHHKRPTRAADSSGSAGK